MRAVVFDRELRFDPHRPDPTPAEGECLVRVHLAGICATDLHITRGYMNFTGVLGHEFVGTVEEGTAQWVGKRVACEINCVCRTCEMCASGLRNHCLRRTVVGIDGRDGCFADFVAVPQDNLHEVPDAVHDEEAVFVEPLAAAYQVITQCRVEKRMNVCVLGPGRLGLLVAQVLKTVGCRLTAVGRNRDKLLLCEKRGIQAQHVDEVVPRQDYDLVVECTGSPQGLDLASSLVRPRGTIVLKSTYAGRSELNLAPLVVHEINLVGSRCGPFSEAIQALARKAVEVRSMISRTFPLEHAAEAFAAAQDSRHVKILLKISPRRTVG
ncbi:MAG: alcohol dehydrogenase catalytic domain-containing protein [Phycisphaerae bacterium]